MKLFDFDCILIFVTIFENALVLRNVANLFRKRKEKQYHDYTNRFGDVIDLRR